MIMRSVCKWLKEIDNYYQFKRRAKHPIHDYNNNHNTTGKAAASILMMDELFGIMIGGWYESLYLGYYPYNLPGFCSRVHLNTQTKYEKMTNLDI